MTNPNQSEELREAMSDTKAEIEDTTISDLLMHLQQDSIKVEEPFWGEGMDKIAELRRNTGTQLEALFQDRLKRAEVEARIEVASKITIGGHSGSEAFYENIPLERYLAQLNQSLE